tara:strand:- start:2087 stop:2614 length:528 start_codon:yes stop_codon:yes gene_type:complete
MKKIILINGGTKSGKSKFAEYLAKKHKKIVYVALSEDRPDDILWNKKVQAHKKRRPEHWLTIETNNFLKVLKEEREILLVDSIGGFVTCNLSKNNDEWNHLLLSLIKEIKKYKNEIIIVCEQVGYGLVSEYEIGNKFIERMGEVLQEITLISNENWLTINGKVIRLDTLFIDLEE